ncbi:MAG TPA: cation:proton antiporter [Chlamydiales bacterium]|nr:cation:proton antiporter [Chlamydiales bacterium]
MDNSFHILTYIGLLFILSQIFGRISQYLKSPAILGYLIAGILFGPSLFGLYPKTLISENLYIITDIALSIIAFSIGEALRISEIKKIKNTIFTITILQAFFAAIFVWLACLIVVPWLFPTTRINGFASSYLPIILLLGTVSVTTAPDAIMSLIHEYKAKGKFTTLLLSIISLDDAITIILYSFVIMICKSLVLKEPLNVENALIIPLKNILGAISFGIIFGFILKKIIRFFSKKDVLLALIIGSILFTSGLSFSFGFSPLLANMTLGFIVANFIEHKRSEEAYDVIDQIEEPLFGIFFMIAGMELDLNHAFKAGFIAIILLIIRFAGKYTGAYLGASISHSSKTIQKYMGLALFPTAGMTIGLILEAHSILSGAMPLLTSTMINAVIGATLINELISPYFVKQALYKSGNIS